MLAALAACGGSSVAKPALQPQPSDAYEEVPYPPPSALVEIVPPQPRPDAVWMDGYWAWSGQYYIWERGGWVMPPRDARLSKWDARYRPDGVLLYAPTRWRDGRGRVVATPRFLLPAASPPAQETAEPATTP